MPDILKIKSKLKYRAQIPPFLCQYIRGSATFKDKTWQVKPFQGHIS